MAALPPNPELEYSFPIDATQVPSLGREYELVPKELDRKRISERLNINTLTSLKASVHVTIGRAGVIEVRGHISAHLTQPCVVTLEPVEEDVEEDFELRFTRQVSKPTHDIEIDQGDDPPDELTGDVLDLGEVVVEQLALAMNPYPRAAGAKFNAHVYGEPEPETAKISPFAALSKLKTSKKNN